MEGEKERMVERLVVRLVVRLVRGHSHRGGGGVEAGVRGAAEARGGEGVAAPHQAGAGHHVRQPGVTRPAAVAPTGRHLAALSSRGRGLRRHLGNRGSGGGVAADVGHQVAPVSAERARGHGRGVGEARPQLVRVPHRDDRQRGGAGPRPARTAALAAGPLARAGRGRGNARSTVVLDCLHLVCLSQHVKLGEVFIVQFDRWAVWQI